MLEKSTEIEKPDTSGKGKSVEEHSFVSPFVITIKNDISEKNALDSLKPINSCIEVQQQLRNMKELKNQITV